MRFDRRAPLSVEPSLFEHVDSEYGRNRTTGRSDEGTAMFLNNNLIAFSTKAQTSVADSSFHAEIIALSDGVSKLLKLRNYLQDTGFTLPPTPVFEDNRAVIRYARDIGMARAARSLVQHFHKGRAAQQDGSIDLRPISSANNAADFFTKIQPRKVFQRSMQLLGLTSLSTPSAICHRPAVEASGG